MKYYNLTKQQHRVLKLLSKVVLFETNKTLCYELYHNRIRYNENERKKLNELRATFLPYLKIELKREVNSTNSKVYNVYEYGKPVRHINVQKVRYTK